MRVEWLERLLWSRDKRRECDFEEGIQEMKYKEHLAELVDDPYFKEEARIYRGLMMAHEGMTIELELFSLRDETLKRKVNDLIERRDVEEVHRLWLKYCGYRE